MTGFDTSVFQQPKSVLLKKILILILSEILVAFGLAFNSCAELGTDPISVLSDGIHAFFHIDLGLAFNISNYTLLFIVFIFGRRYLNIGTFIGTLPLGFFINVGVKIYNLLNICNSLEYRIVMAIIACFLLFFGTAVVIALNIGQDPWTGLAMMLSEITSKSYRFFRIIIDLSALTVGILLGGGFGIVTIVAALLGGPTIQFFSQKIKNYLKYLNIN